MNYGRLSQLRVAIELIKEKNFYCAHRVLRKWPCKQTIISLIAWAWKVRCMAYGITLCLSCHNDTKEGHLRSTTLRPLGLVDRKCKYCGNIKKVWPSQSDRPFCNKQCLLSWNKAKKEKTI